MNHVLSTALRLPRNENEKSILCVVTKCRVGRADLRFQYTVSITNKGTMAVGKWVASRDVASLPKTCPNDSQNQEWERLKLGISRVFPLIFPLSCVQPFSESLYNNGYSHSLPQESCGV